MEGGFLLGNVVDKLWPKLGISPDEDTIISVHQQKSVDITTDSHFMSPTHQLSLLQWR